MQRCCVLVLLVVVLAVACAPARAQEDTFYKNRVAGLKGLRETALVFRSTEAIEAMGRSEVIDLVTMSLTRAVPGLKLISNTEDSDSLLEVTCVGQKDVVLVGLSVYRWAQLVATGDRVFTTVWSRNMLITDPDSLRGGFKEALDRILVVFSSEYVRANGH